MTVPVARELVDTLYAAAPVPRGCRVNHARGILVEGVFRPSPAASRLSGAGIFAGPEVPALARFSSLTGDPEIREDDPNADPRGLAVSFGDPAELILVGHSVEAFPAIDGASFLQFLLAAAASEHRPEPFQRHLASDAAARHFMAARVKRPPCSFSGETYHMLHPYRLGGGDRADAIGRLSVVGVSNETVAPIAATVRTTSTTTCGPS